VRTNKGIPFRSASRPGLRSELGPSAPRIDGEPSVLRLSIVFSVAGFIAAGIVAAVTSLVAFHAQRFVWYSYLPLRRRRGRTAVRGGDQVKTGDLLKL
jgi:hypothetical protein